MNPPESPVQVNRAKMARSLLWVTFNTLVVGYWFVRAAHPVMRWRGCGVGAELPSVGVVLRDGVVFMVLAEAWFYYTHR